MHTPYIDIHTHCRNEQHDVLSLQNCIVGKDYFPSVACSVGIHPWYIDIDFDKQCNALETYAARENVLAIGECGLDKLTKTKWEKQIKCFEQQIQLANIIGKPLIIHCVRAYQETFQVLLQQKVTVPVIFHGFNKNIALAQSVLKQGYLISLGADMLKGAKNNLITNLPLEKIFLETDDKSISIVDIYTYFCAARKISIDQLRNELAQNFQNVFKYSYL
ncbi:TatD family deoxyribonuclease [Sphingobacterium alkalisoli]|uniref:TatD family deoxyribonuclease n=1 Tax=Sphingobacterium alkalisoli TaxID=1874115 RepID=A0A4U0GXG4_9SPHI|nr:TatD family hydrolase [Sphingobacterium alkalisoli]TJY63865.1 TatD family deoxyribonuclease [Sphingobacterium alkalisoli]GGH24379.1 TatD family hydrolase [Sphingobacterium alkalisoli]